jgi:hypothetical protein
MNRIKFIAVFVFSVFIFANIASAQTGGGSGLSFLKFGFGARNAAMGDAGVALASDVTALFYNPARLANNGTPDVIFTHNNWIQDVRSEMVGAKASFFGLPLAFGVNVTSINDIEIRTKPGAPDATFNANYFSGSVSTGFSLTSDLDVGASVKYLYENIFVDEANGLGFDLGIFYRTPVNGLNISAVVRNLGSMNTLRNVSTKLPTEVRAGTSYEIEIPGSKISLLGGAEYLSYTRDNENHLNFGGEATYNHIFSLRAGYMTNYQSKGFTAGMGIVWGNLNLDYAYLPFKLGLGNASMFSIQFKF